MRIGNKRFSSISAIPSVIGTFLMAHRSKTVYIICFGIVLFLFFWTNPVFTDIGSIKIWDKNGILLYESNETIGNKQPVRYEQLPESLIQAVVAQEDAGFWTNPGVEPVAILRSVIDNFAEFRIVSGASTITQQLVRAAIISPNRVNSRSYVRKFREIIMAVRVSMFLSKKEILTRYFNTMYFGNNLYGIEAASQGYFHKNTDRLSLSECAFIVGLLSSPDSYDPYTKFDRAKKRQEQVLSSMKTHGYISDKKRLEAQMEIVAIEPLRQTLKAPHFVAYVLSQLEDMGVDARRGLQVYTTLDEPVYDMSRRIAKFWIDQLRIRHHVTNAAVILLKNSTGEIVSMMGGLDYSDSTHSGQVNMTTALRQPGSTLKPITYAAAFQKGFTPATMIFDVPTTYKTKKGEGYQPNNYDGRFHGIVLAREALASSLNLPAVDMLSRIGLDTFLTTARMLGLRKMTENERYDLSITLGGGEVSLLELANTYASFGRGGSYMETYAIEKITSDDGRILYVHKQKEPIRVLGQNGEAVSYLISDILSDPHARMLGFQEKNPLVLSRPAAVKTGTTTDWHDNWTIGYTPSYTVGVWVGNTDNGPMEEITGVVGAAPIWNQFFEEFLLGKPVEQFARPESVVDVEVCKTDGFLPAALCTQRYMEHFIRGTEPKLKSSIHTLLSIDVRNNLLASTDCPKEVTVEKLFTDYPKEVYSWAVREGREIMPTDYSPLCGQSWNPSSASQYISVISPREKTVYQSAPLIVPNETVRFEVQVSADIVKVEWMLDGKVYMQSATQPFSVVWRPEIGAHTVQAVGITKDASRITSDPVSFSVVSFHSD